VKKVGEIILLKKHLKKSKKKSRRLKALQSKKNLLEKLSLKILPEILLIQTSKQLERKAG